MNFFSSKKSDENKLNPEKEMSFLEHLEELRWTIIRALLYVFVFSILFFMFKDFIFDHVIFAHLSDNFPVYLLACSFGESMCLHAPNLEFITRVMGEQFFVHIKVSIYLGFIFSFPFILREIWKFVSPGLKNNEKNITGKIILVCSTLFYFGVLFGYFVIATFAIKFFSEYTVGDFAVTKPTLDSYVGFLTMITLPVGIVFELPVVVYFLSKAGIVTSKGLSMYRRHSIIVIMVIAAIITPPDFFTQILIGIPIMLIYEGSIIVAKRIERK